jgi:putative ABC transport system substrate-binding protein
MAINRRSAILSLAAAGALGVLRGVAASDAARTARIGFIANASPQRNPQLEAFREGLHGLGYVEGKNIAIDYRWAQGRLDARADIAQELVQQGVDVIVTWGTPATAAAQKATSSVPIVMVAVADPVGSGFVRSLAKPGGNITGASNAMVDIGGKWVELMTQLVPEVKTVAILRNPANAGSAAWTREAEQAARNYGIRALVLDAASIVEIDRAFDAVRREGAGALIITGDPFFAGQRERLADLARRNRLPSSFVASFYPDAGGLMSYGMDVTAMFRRAASFVDRILKGAAPADLPVEQPTVFQLVINLETAVAIGIEVPQSLLLRADRIIR